MAASTQNGEKGARTVHAIRNRSGFSLTELMIVVAIIGILAVIAIPNFLKYQARAKQSEAKTNLVAIHTSEMAYFAEKNAYVDDFNAIGFAVTGSSQLYYYELDNNSRYSLIVQILPLKSINVTV